MNINEAIAEQAEHVAQRRAPAVSRFGCSYVPVSFVAKDWNVTPRRIRALLAAQRLQGRREANGYWEVATSTSSSSEPVGLT